MEEDYTLTKKYHNFLIYLFSSFSSQHNNIIKIIITINSEHFLNLKNFIISHKIKILETLENVKADN